MPVHVFFFLCLFVICCLCDCISGSKPEGVKELVSIVSLVRPGDSCVEAVEVLRIECVEEAEPLNLCFPFFQSEVGLFEPYR